MFTSYRTAVALLGCSALLIAAASWAAPLDETRDRESAGASDSSKADSQLAAWLAVDNQVEIALAKLAQERTQNDQVRQFAEQMVEEHTQFLSKLTQHTGSEIARADRAPRADGGRADSDAEKAGGGARNDKRKASRDNPVDANQARGGAARAGQGVDFIALKKELGQECLQSAQQELVKKEEAEFDQCYMFGQVMAHMKMVDTLTVFKNHATGEFRQLLDEGIETSEKHLAQAKELVEELESPTVGAREVERR